MTIISPTPYSTHPRQPAPTYAFTLAQHVSDKRYCLVVTCSRHDYAVDIQASRATLFIYMHLLCVGSRYSTKGFRSISQLIVAYRTPTFSYKLVGHGGQYVIELIGICQLPARGSNVLLC